MYILTEEGRRYLEKGLPERRLLEALGRPTPLRELGTLEDFSIGLQWAKKKGWVEVSGNSVARKVKPEYAASPEADALRAIARGADAQVAGQLLDVLVRRKLIEQVRDDVKRRAERQVAGGATTLTPELIASGRWREVIPHLKPYDVAASGKRLHPGKRHPYALFLAAVRRRLVELGFREMTGPLIETEFWNFDALFQPQNHPSRDWTQTYSLASPKEGDLPPQELVRRVQAAHEHGWTTGSSGWGYRWNPRKAARLMPRAHATALSARTLSAGPSIPGKYFAIARCFRPDVIDATHGVEFNQTDGIVIDESLSFRSLLGILKHFATEFAGAEDIRFLPDYYPFTEPSVQMSARHPRLGWIEFGGAGIFREELTMPLGVEEPVIAWGIGIDRLAMFRLGLTDIRELFTRDLAWLRRQVVV